MLILAFAVLIAFFREPMRRLTVRENSGMMRHLENSPFYCCTKKLKVANCCITQQISACCHLIATSLHHHKVYTPRKLL